MFNALNETLEAYQRRDPAARSKLEIFLLYQGYTPFSFTESATSCGGTTAAFWPG